MNRNSEYELIPTDCSEMEAEMISDYESLTGVALSRSSPEYLMIKWVESIILKERVKGNYAANQNLPSRAEGENLDALAELFYADERPGPQAAFCTMRFHISEAQTSAILIPAGIRVTDESQTLYWETLNDVYVPIGATYVDTTVQCQTTGTVGNGYLPGTINTIVDVYDYYSACENISVSDGGSGVMEDDEFYELLRSSLDGHSTAGARGSYVYHAKSVSSEIADVVVNSPSPGVIRIYALKNDGTKASDTMKQAIYDECSADNVRPLTDHVVMGDPEEVEYDIIFTYYVSTDITESAAAIAESIQAAVEEYVLWQAGKIGRDINPSKLISMLMATGIKRVELDSPAFAQLRDGSNIANSVPQVAKVNTVRIVNGGAENE